MHWRCSFALEAAQGLGLPVLFTEQVPAKLGRTVEDLLALPVLSRHRAIARRRLRHQRPFCRHT